MATLNGHPLPSIVIYPGDDAAILKELSQAPIEAFVETIAYIDYQIAAVDAVKDFRGQIVELLKDRLAKLPATERGTRRVDAAVMTYSEGGETVSLIDRDATVDALSDEQVRASYKPDLKALEVMLRPEEFNRLVKREPKPPVVGIRKTGIRKFHELDDADGDDS